MGSAIDITPMLPEGARLITRYGGGQFAIADLTYQGSVIVLPNSVVEVSLAFDETFQSDMLQAVYDCADEIDLLVVGCGASFGTPPKALRSALKDHGIVLEWMDTGAACRTFNVLLAEGRLVAAALIATE